MCIGGEEMRVKGCSWYLGQRYNTVWWCWKKLLAEKKLLYFEIRRLGYSTFVHSTIDSHYFELEWEILLDRITERFEFRKYLIGEKMSEFYLVGVLIRHLQAFSSLFPDQNFKIVTFPRPNLQFSHFHQMNWFPSLAQKKIL